MGCPSGPQCVDDHYFHLVPYGTDDRSLHGPLPTRSNTTDNVEIVDCPACLKHIAVYRELGKLGAWQAGEPDVASVHTCHDACPCQTGGKPMGDFVGD